MKLQEDKVTSFYLSFNVQVNLMYSFKNLLFLKKMMRVPSVMQ